MPRRNGWEAMALRITVSLAPPDAGGEGESWETRRTYMGESPGITLRLPGTPATSAGPGNICRAYGRAAAGGKGGGIKIDPGGVGQGDNCQRGPVVGWSTVVDAINAPGTADGASQVDGHDDAQYRGRRDQAGSGAALRSRACRHLPASSGRDHFVCSGYYCFSRTALRVSSEPSVTVICFR